VTPVVSPGALPLAALPLAALPLAALPLAALPLAALLLAALPLAALLLAALLLAALLLAALLLAALLLDELLLQAVSTTSAGTRLSIRNVFFLLDMCHSVLLLAYLRFMLIEIVHHDWIAFRPERVNESARIRVRIVPYAAPRGLDP
jgi:hypothetical protein